ncbi:MAG: ferredoxin [Pseudomonadota bacterium]|nr:ferredoxin [Pseudomonadota bacterium]
MSNRESHLSAAENAPGRFRVLPECICCALCADIAPEHFRPNDEETNHVVYRQPITAREVALCRDALEACPVETITDKGADDQLSIASTACARSSSSFAWRSAASCVAPSTTIGALPAA